MRSMLLLACAVAPAVVAAPLSFTFTGTTDYLHLWQHDGTPITTRPDQPLWSAGIRVFDGNLLMQGHFTLDLDAVVSADDCLFLPLTYELSTEGASWQRTSGWGCTDTLEMNDTRLAWHVEGPNLTHVGGLDSSIQSFVFNFLDGNFVDGWFTLDYMWGHDLYGTIGGSINGMRPAPARAVTVPEPGTALLLGAGLVALGLWRRY